MFHPSISRQNDGDRLLSLTLTASETVDTEQGLVSLLNECFFLPLQDPLSFTQYRPSENAGNTCASVYLRIGHQCIALNLSNQRQAIADLHNHLPSIPQTETLILDFRPLHTDYYRSAISLLACFARRQSYKIPFTLRLHQGWHEGTEDYIYRNYRQSAERIVHFEPNGGFGHRLLIIIDNAIFFYLSDCLQALQTEANIFILWERQGFFNIPNGHCLRSGSIETHININESPLNPDFSADRIELMSLDIAALDFSTKPPNTDRGIELNLPETAVSSSMLYLTGFIKLYLSVESFYPFLDAQTWRKAWPEYLPKIRACNSLEEYQNLLSNLLALLHDGHARVFFPALHKQGASKPEPKHLNLLSPAMAHIRILANNIGYMTPFTMPDRQVLAQAFSLLKNTDALVMDLRGYPCCHFKHELLQHISHREILSPRYQIPLITAGDSSVKQWQTIQYRVAADRSSDCYLQPIVALIDGSMQSAAEDVCMYLKQSGRVTFIGKKTAGCQGNACFVELPFDGFASFTGMEVIDSAGRTAATIEPDIEIEQDDDILPAAIRFLKQK